MYIISVTIHPRTQEFSEVTILPADVKNSWFKSTFKDINNLINNQNFIMDDPEKVYLETPRMDV